MAHRGLVGLVGPHQVGQQPGGPPDTQDQQTGGHGVEGAGVADPAGGGQAPDGGDDVVAGGAGGLVDQEQAVGGGDRAARRPEPGGGGPGIAVPGAVGGAGAGRVAGVVGAGWAAGVGRAAGDRGRSTHAMTSGSISSSSTGLEK